MNLSKHIKVSYQEWVYWKDYLISSGYELMEVKKDDSVDVTVFSSGEVSSDFAMARQKSEGRWINWITIRIPHSKKDKEWC